MFGLALKLGGIGLKALAKGLPRNTVFSKMLRPAFGLAAGVGAGAAGSALVTQQGSGLPNLPSLSGVTGGTLMPSQFPSIGTLPFWRGPNGKFQMPWQDPNVANYLKQFALDDAYLKVSYRAPKGYVVVRDPKGKPYCLLKSAAKFFGLWHPARKPPISAGDWHKYQTAHAVVKKLRKIASHGLAKKPAKQFPSNVHHFAKRKAA
jgi:hypothetical protein